MAGIGGDGNRALAGIGGGRNTAADQAGQAADGGTSVGWSLRATFFLWPPGPSVFIPLLPNFLIWVPYP